MFQKIGDILSSKTLRSVVGLYLMYVEDWRLSPQRGDFLQSAMAGCCGNTVGYCWWLKSHSQPVDMIVYPIYPSIYRFHTHCILGGVGFQPSTVSQSQIAHRGSYFLWILYPVHCQECTSSRIHNENVNHTPSQKMASSWVTVEPVDFVALP